jgi:DNA-binding PadR family transcriptional regulator
MLRSHSNAETLLVSALTYDFAFDILEQLKTVGMTTGELVDKLPGGPAHNAVCACLKRLRGAGLLFRFRSDARYEWWVDRSGIAAAAARLTEFAATIPERNLDMISEELRKKASISRLTKFFAISYRRDILQTLRKHPSTAGEIYKNISPGVGPNAIILSLHMLEEFGLVAIKTTFLNKQVGRLIVKRYNITHRGTVALDALQGDRPLLDILKAVRPC